MNQHSMPIIRELIASEIAGPNAVCPIEVSRALAIAIGYRNDDVRSIHPSKSWDQPATLEVYFNGAWRTFSYMDHMVLNKIMERFKVKLTKRKEGFSAVAVKPGRITRHAAIATTPQLAVALAVVDCMGINICHRELAVLPMHLKFAYH